MSKRLCDSCGGEFELLRGALVCVACGRYWRVRGGSQGSSAPKGTRAPAPSSARRPGGRPLAQLEDQGSPLTTGTAGQRKSEGRGGEADPLREG